MVFTKRLRDRVRRGEITCSLGMVDLLKVAKHGKGQNIYLVRFHYVNR